MGEKTPEEAWEDLQELNEEVDWDIENMLPELESVEERD